MNYENIKDFLNNFYIYLDCIIKGPINDGILITFLSIYAAVVIGIFTIFFGLFVWNDLKKIGISFSYANRNYFKYSKEIIYKIIFIFISVIIISLPNIFFINKNIILLLQLVMIIFLFFNSIIFIKGLFGKIDLIEENYFELLFNKVFNGVDIVLNKHIKQNIINDSKRLSTNINLIDNNIKQEYKGISEEYEKFYLFINKINELEEKNMYSKIIKLLEHFKNKYINDDFKFFQLIIFVFYRLNTDFKYTLINYFGYQILNNIDNKKVSLSEICDFINDDVRILPILIEKRNNYNSKNSFRLFRVIESYIDTFLGKETINLNNSFFWILRSYIYDKENITSDIFIIDYLNLIKKIIFFDIDNKSRGGKFLDFNDSFKIKYGDLFKEIYSTFGKQPFSDISFGRFVIDEFFIKIIEKLGDKYFLIISFIKLCYTNIDDEYFHTNILKTLKMLYKEEILIKNDLDHIITYFKDYNLEDNFRIKDLDDVNNFDEIAKKYYGDYLDSLLKSK